MSGGLDPAFPPVRLDISNLSVSFSSSSGEHSAVNGLSLSIAPGAALGLVGESGSGKSLTARSIMRLLPSSAIWRCDSMMLGVGESNSIDMFNCGEDEVRRLRGNVIGYIPQSPGDSLDPLKTVGSQILETIVEHLRLSRSDAYERAMSLFSGVSLPSPRIIMERYPHQLSGGQLQRVCIAIAMCCDPGLILADEPTTALDASTRLDIIDLINEIRVARGVSFLFISHDVNVVSAVCSDVAIIRNGEIIESGDSGILKGGAKESYTKALLHCHPGLNRGRRFLPTIEDYEYDGVAGVADNGQASTALRSERVDIISRLDSDRSGSGIPQVSDWAELISVDNLSISYDPPRLPVIGRPGKFVVNDVSFSVQAGETLGIVGESGSGKSTIGLALLGLLKFKGRIHVDGMDISSLARSGRKRLSRFIQPVFQDASSSLDPRLTIADLLLEPLLLHKNVGNTKFARSEMDSIIEEKMSDVGLGSVHLRRYPGQLSGGQLQRVCIARALVIEPRVLLLDEGVSALDLSSQAKVLNVLVDLKSRLGLSYIFISHDLSVIEFIADRTVVMQDGLVVEAGVTSELTSDPKHPYTKRLLSGSFLAGRVG